MFGDFFMSCDTSDLAIHEKGGRVNGTRPPLSCIVNSLLYVELGGGF